MNFIFPVSGTDGNGLVESAAIGKFRMSGNSTGPLKRATKKKKSLKYFQTSFFSKGRKANAFTCPAANISGASLRRMPPSGSFRSRSRNQIRELSS